MNVIRDLWVSRPKVLEGSDRLASRDGLANELAINSDVEDFHFMPLRCNDHSTTVVRCIAIHSVHLPRDRPARWRRYVLARLAFVVRTLMRAVLVR